MLFQRRSPAFVICSSGVVQVLCGAVVQFWGDRGEELRPIIALSAGANCATLLEFLNSI